MIRRAWVLMLFIVSIAGCKSGGPDASGKRERCGRLYDRLIECKGFSEMVLREYDGKDAFVEACGKEWNQSRRTVACLDQETCGAFHQCAFGMSERDLRMLESIGTPPSGTTPVESPEPVPPPEPPTEPAPSTDAPLPESGAMSRE
jgi:hypothetical protein